MKRKDYQKPTTTIVRLQQSYILTGSQDPPQKRGDVEDYEVQSERFW